MNLNEILNNKVIRQTVIGSVCYSTDLYLLSAKSYLQKNGKIISKTVGMLTSTLAFSRICDYGTAQDRRDNKPYLVTFRFYERTPDNKVLSSPIYDKNGDESKTLNIIFHDAAKLLKLKEVAN